eukprot:915367-Rhodomonas_salina.2
MHPTRSALGLRTVPLRGVSALSALFGTVMVDGGMACAIPYGAMTYAVLRQRTVRWAVLRQRRCSAVVCGGVR